MSERFNFVVVSGEGVRDPIDGSPEWNAGACCYGPFPGFPGHNETDRSADDVLYARDVLSYIKNDLGISIGPAFATGFSNGGMLSHRLGCQASDIFIGIAPHGGQITLGGDGFNECKPTNPPHVIHFHGTADLLVPYEGNENFPGCVSNMNTWLVANGCIGSTEISYSSPTTTCERASRCQNGSTVEFCAIVGLGHSWSRPGGGGGQPVTNIDSSVYLFTRFAEIVAAL